MLRKQEHKSILSGAESKGGDLEGQGVVVVVDVGGGNLTGELVQSQACCSLFSKNCKGKMHYCFI